MNTPVPMTVPALDRRSTIRGSAGNTGHAALWLPPDRMRRYQWNKVIGGLLVSMIFIGWLIVQWSNPAMRMLAAGLIAVTCWVVVRSMLDDARRHRGRQLGIAEGVLHIVTPGGASQVCLADVAVACWRQGDRPGLWFYDRQNRPLAHLDTFFLADQAEARNFLGWARRHADLPFDVRWPPTPDKPLATSFQQGPTR